MELQQLITSIDGWLDNNGFINKEIREKLEKIDFQLEGEKQNVLFLADFSSGKSELINATMFGSIGQRFLPSSPGETTRCTTIIEHNPEEVPSLKLLPTLGPDELSRQPISLIDPDSPYWQRTLFSASDAKSIIRAFKQITETEQVTPEMAKEYGFTDAPKGQVTIPKYRYAVINFPHPVLKQGLSIVDTPGLNALWIEPEFTLRLLDSANAIVFVLAADAGVTRSELAAWDTHVKKHHIDNPLVVINKIDTLWDEIKSKDEIELMTRELVAEVAEALEIPTSRIYPLSAQKSLLGRKKKDARIITDSGIEQYELALADTINFNKRVQVINAIRDDITSTFDVVTHAVDHSAADTKSQIVKIQGALNDKSKLSDGILEKIKNERETLERATKKIDLFRAEMKTDYDNFANSLDIFALDKLIARYKLKISKQLTTPGLQQEMQDFQSQAIKKFQSALTHMDSLKSKLVTLFGSVEEILEIKGLEPRIIHPAIYLNTLQKYRNHHAKQIKEIDVSAAEQSELLDRLHAASLVKTRHLYMQTKDEVDLWCKTALTPVELELRGKWSYLKKRLINLARIREEGIEIVDEVKLLRTKIQALDQQKNAAGLFRKRLEELAQSDKPVSSPSPGNVTPMRERVSVNELERS